MGLHKLLPDLTVPLLPFLSRGDRARRDDSEPALGSGLGIGYLPETFIGLVIVLLLMPRLETMPKVPSAFLGFYRTFTLLGGFP